MWEEAGFQMVPKDDRRSLTIIVCGAILVGICSVAAGLAHIHWF